MQVWLFNQFYTFMFTSKFSASVPPQLRVNPSVITETDSVTLDCQTPSSVSVSQCHFYTSSGVNLRDSSCLLTLTGTELLTMSHQGSSADIKVNCFYTVKFGESDSPSPHSDAASITIHSEWLLLSSAGISISWFYIGRKNAVWWICF